jgi:hypothetical protein
MKMRNINKINYEQFAMDYLEGNLSGDLLQEMNTFLEKNPAIKKELDEMDLFYLEADESVVFEEKETLLQPVPSRKIFFFIPIFLIASCLLVGMFISVLFFTNNNSFENKIAVEEKNSIEINEDNIINNDNKIIEKIKNNESLIPKKTIEESIKKNNISNKSLPTNTPKKYLNDEQPIANNKEKNTPVYQEKPTVEKPKYISPIIPEKPENQAIANNNNDKPEDKIEKYQPIRETAMIAAINLEPVDDAFSIKIQLESMIAVTDKITEPKKQSRLARIGLIPSTEGRRKISFKTIKEALIPEGLALRE